MASSKTDRRVKSRVTEQVLLTQGPEGQRWLTVMTPENIVIFVKVDLATGQLVNAESFQA